MISFILCLLAILAALVGIGALFAGTLFLLYRYFEEDTVMWIMCGVAVVMFFVLGWEICGDFGCRP